MSGVGSRETGLDSLFASKPVGPGFEPCLGKSANLAGAPKPLCLSVYLSIYLVKLLACEVGVECHIAQNLDALTIQHKAPP